MGTIQSILAGKHENHIFPFLWLRDQSEEVLRTEIDKIYGCGIRAVCLESRPHPDFGGPGWWHDFDIVLDEAKKRGMKIWILDDAHFPTGQANGLVPAKYPERARKYAMMQYVDCAGPIASASLDVALLMTKQFTWMDFGKPVNKPLIDRQELISVTAARLIEGDTVGGEILDLTARVKDGWLTWDVPGGVWRICVSFTTYDFGANNEYINYIDRESVSTLIEAVYQPHYEHYAAEFGKTIAGFFSDEPGFYSVGGYAPGNAIGRKKMPLPWSDELESRLTEANPNWRTQLPYLWLDCSEADIALSGRYTYMDLVSQLYARNFSCQLGDWCKAHGVEYIGHVIEDYDEHSRLGMGAGHYFRAMQGQHMAGIDDIGGQIIPGNPYGTRHSVTADSEGIFYHYALPKMGASAAAIDPAKGGRLMCEAYGAYGWSFGVKHMKWLTDYLLFQGVNHLVPHAFSMAEYPDTDCPPHFYARGHNPQYPYFAALMEYANRLCDLLSGGVNVPQVALLYPAEHDWLNESMKLQAPARQLTEHQMDFTILPLDVFQDRPYYGVSLEGGVLTVNGRAMKAVVVPATRCIERKEAEILSELKAVGIPVIFVDSLPETVLGGAKLPAGMEVVALRNLASYLRCKGIGEIKLSTPSAHLLAYHYRTHQDIFCLFNTDLSETIDTQITLPIQGDLVRYDAMANHVYPVQHKNGTLHLHLGPYESLVLLAGDVQGLLPEDTAGSAMAPKQPKQVLDLSRDWAVSKVSALQYPDFSAPEQVETLAPITAETPDFSGVVRYEKTVDLPEAASVLFQAEHVYEAAELFVNGVSAGKKLTPPYTWDISGLCAAGENTIAVEVANTPARDARKAFSPFGPERVMLEPAGMFGKVQLVLA